MGFGSVSGITFVKYQEEYIDVFDIDKERKYNLKLPDSDVPLVIGIRGNEVFGEMVRLSDKNSSYRNILCDGSIVVEDANSEEER